jgi:mannose-6-phosphate isomerase-like protein (cupin superfamily)
MHYGQDMDRPVDLDAALDGIAEPFDPRIAATVNDYDVKIAKVEGGYVWHAHAETDEFFLVLSGRLSIELEGRSPVELGPHEVFTVPRGLRHRPVGEPGTRFLMFEPRETLNSGDSGAAGTTGRPLP